MTEATKLSYFGTVPGTGNYTTIFVDVSIFQQLGYTLFCSANGTLDINWSMDGINTDLTETATFTAGNTITGSVRRHTKFVQLDVTSTNGAQLRFQTHLNANSPGIHALDNTGTGAQIYDKSGGKIRSLLSSDTSITITEAVDHIDLVNPGVLSLDHNVPPFSNSYSIVKSALPASGNIILNWLTDDNTTDGGVIWTEDVSGYLTAKATLSGVTLSSAGGTQTLVTDGTGPTLGIKGLTAGTNITLTPTANDITISAGGGSNWTVSGSGTTGYVYPTAVTGVVANVPSNTITAGATNITVLSSQNTTHKGSQCASIGCDFQRWQGSATCTGCVALACVSTNIDRNSGLVRQFIQGACDSVGSSSVGDITTSVVLACAGGGMSRGKESAIFACNNSTMNCSGTADIVMASGSSYIQGASTNSVILAGSSSTITGCNQTVVIGQAVNASGTKSFTCNLGTLSFNTTTANKWNVKAPGGAVYYSDDSATVGVSLASGGNSWASVSDMNKKENLVVVDYQEIMDKVDKLNVYSYNYKGNPSAQRCYGTTAQEWHSEDAFKCDEYECDEIDEEGNLVKIMKCGKNCLVIEMQDQIGVLMACIKNLNARIKDLESKII